MKQWITNLRTPISVFLNQTSSGAWVALANQACTSVMFTVQPSATAGVNNCVQVRRGSSGGQVYLTEGEPYEIAVQANSNELQIQQAQGTTPIVGYECR